MTAINRTNNKATTAFSYSCDAQVYLHWKWEITEPCSVLLTILPSIFCALSQNNIVMLLSIMQYDIETGYFKGYQKT
jgi:hypothetical protein